MFDHFDTQITPEETQEAREYEWRMTPMGSLLQEAGSYQDLLHHTMDMLRADAEEAQDDEEAREYEDKIEVLAQEVIKNWYSSQG